MNPEGVRAEATAPRLTLFATEGCHLCEQAERMIGATTPANVAWQILDIMNDPALLQRYGTRIPVLRHDTSDDELDWPFDAFDLQRFLTTHCD